MAHFRTSSGYFTIVSERQIPTWICAERHGSSMLACRTGRRRAFWSNRNQRRRALRDVLLLCSSALGRRMW